MTTDKKVVPEESWNLNPDDTLPAEAVPAEDQQQVSMTIPDEFRIDENAVAVWSKDEHGRTVVTFNDEAHAKEALSEFEGDHNINQSGNND
jgi:hypothetical protein